MLDLRLKLNSLPGLCWQNNFGAGIIFGFRFHCKRIVAIFMGWRTAAFLNKKPF